MSVAKGLIKTGLALLCAAIGTPTAASQPADATPGALELRRPPDIYRLVKHFDFDERKLGHFEDVPLHWEQLRGPGFPALYAYGRFDDRVGYRAPPSFHLTIATGNVAYEYRHLDLNVVPESDYLISGYIRPHGLKYAGAFIAAYFVDRFGERIAGSERISRVVRATGQDPEAWQRVEVELAGEFPAAHVLRLQLWILQDSVWREPDPREADPIVRRDVFAGAWFDDISVYRLPRVELGLSNPAGLVQPGRREEIVVAVNNATPQPLRAEVQLLDDDGRVHHHQELKVPALVGPFGFTEPQSGRSDAADGSTAAWSAGGPERHRVALRAPLPELPPGFYTARLRVSGEAEALLERRTRFAVLPDLPVRPTPQPDLGVDLGRWQGGSVTGLLELLAALGCGAAKVGVSADATPGEPEESTHLQALADLLRRLAEKRIETTGVILPPATGGDLGRDSIRRLVARDGPWRNLLSPALAYFGALLPAWQLGAEQIELRDGETWQPDQIERVRHYLRQFVTLPKLVIPLPITAATAYQDDTLSLWIPPQLPTRTLVRELDFLVDGDAASYWLLLDPPDGAELSRTRWLTDLARRLVLTKALRPGRVYVPAPFHLSRTGGRLAWEPADEFLALRTLFWYLSGKTARAAMVPAPDTVAVIFAGPESSSMLIWTWREDPLPEPVELYLGEAARGMDLWGRPVALETHEGRTRLPVGPAPLIVDHLDAPLALLQASYRLAPTYVEVHNPQPGPVLTFSNTFDQRMSGQLRVTPPPNWSVEPAERDFTLEPGATFSLPLALTIPPRQVACSQPLLVSLTLHAPLAATLRFSETLTVGLRDVRLESVVFWQGDDLAVEQTLCNLSATPVSFTAYCRAPGRPLQETEFLDVGPGQFSTRTYLFPRSRDLDGTTLHVGISEIGGPRRLHQFAEVPPWCDNNR